MKKPFAALLAGALAAAALMGGCQKDHVTYGGGLPPEATPSPAPTASPTLPPEETGSQPGHWDGDIYTFDILDLQYVLPDGWFYLTPEQIAASQDGSGGRQDHPNVLLLALDPNGGSTIQVLWEPLPLFAQGEADPEAVLLQVFAGTDFDLECSLGEPFSTRFGALDFMTIQIDIAHQGITMRQFYSVHVEGEGEGAMVLSILLAGDPDAAFEEMPGGVSAFRSS